MNIAVRAPLLFALWLGAFALSGCNSTWMDWDGEQQIRTRIASIRQAILDKRAEGIIEFGTPDWRFDAADGKSYDRASYLVRTKKLFGTIEIESLTTEVIRLNIREPRATVTIRQTTDRTEIAADGTRTRWHVVYWEDHEWIRTAERGWLVARVKLYNVKREPLPATR